MDDDMKRILCTVALLSLTASAVSSAASTNHNAWYASGGIGMDYPHFNANWRVNNGSGFAPPANQDIYTFQNNHHPYLTLATGYRFVRNNAYLPALSLGLNYQYLPSNDVGGQIVQYSTPSFTNYNFKWDITAQLLLLSAKLNIYKYQNLMPYISAAAGAGYIRASSYGETAYPDVTPRTSAGFAESTNTQFVYTLGLGADYQMKSNLLATLGYQYLDLGKIRSGSGSGSWQSATLNLGRYRSNELFLSLTYLFNSGKKR